MDFSIWIVGGLIIVVAATWLVTYNADVLLGLAAATGVAVRVAAARGEDGRRLPAARAGSAPA